MLLEVELLIRSRVPCWESVVWLLPFEGSSDANVGDAGASLPSSSSSLSSSSRSLKSSGTSASEVRGVFLAAAAAAARTDDEEDAATMSPGYSSLNRNLGEAECGKNGALASRVGDRCDDAGAEPTSLVGVV